jgi:hypothetical protein
VAVKLAKTVIITLVKILLYCQLISIMYFKMLKLWRNVWSTWTPHWRWLCNSFRTSRNVFLNKGLAYIGS